MHHPVRRRLLRANKLVPALLAFGSFSLVSTAPAGAATPGAKTVAFEASALLVESLARAASLVTIARSLGATAAAMSHPEASRMAAVLRAFDSLDTRKLTTLRE